MLYQEYELTTAVNEFLLNYSGLGHHNGVPRCFSPWILCG